MKKELVLFTSILVFAINPGLSQIGHSTSKKIILTGKSQSIYKQEPYVGKVEISFQGDSIKEVLFEIIDTLNNEVFGSDYEKHYPNHKLYQQQCRNDWQGVLNYPKQLLEKQDLKKVDAKTGATWSYNLFKAAVDEAFKGKKSQ
jgi:major membrane immunogen (membrane-anchored lipoprotein)